MTTNTTSTSPRHFLTHLLSSLPTAPPSPSLPQNPLQKLPPSHKNLFVTLHVLFPNDFLPALDLLDRRLVTRFSIPSPSSSDSKNADAKTPPQSQPAKHKTEATQTQTLYYVQSAQPQPSHHRYRHTPSHDTTTQNYEVRLLAWNCSCPAFAFAAFPAASSNPATTGDVAGEWAEGAHAGAGAGAASEQAGEEGWVFGGKRSGRGVPPVCKHLLACLLVDRTDLFAGCAEEKRVSLEEAAGWAAGWAG